MTYLTTDDERPLSPCALSGCPQPVHSPAHSPIMHSVSSILRDPTTIRFVPGTDEADLRDLLVKNPQRTPDGFVWLLPDRKTEATITFVGKVIYDVIGDKTGPYFSLPDKLSVRILPSCSLSLRDVDWTFLPDPRRLRY